MNILELIITLISLHFIADWALQNRFIAKWKSKSIEVLLAHCFIYSGVFALFCILQDSFNVYNYLILLVSHFIIDYFTSRMYKRMNWIKVLYFDHILHFIILIIIGMRICI